MSRKRLVGVLATVIVVASVAASGTAHTTDPRNCMGTVTSIPDLDPGSENEPTVIHVDDRLPSGLWVYLETNGHGGLQTGGESVILGPMDVDTCESTHTSGPGSVPDQLVL